MRYNRDRELELLLKKEKDSRDYGEIVSLNEGMIRRLVSSVSAYYNGGKQDLEDMMQVGRMSVVKAAKNYNPKRGVRFCSYYTPIVVHDLVPFVRATASSVKRPAYIKDILFDEPSNGDYDEVVEYVLEEGIDNVRATDYARMIFNGEAAGRCLSAKELFVIRERFKDDPTTLVKIGKKIGVSRERVRQIEAEALAKIRRSHFRILDGGLPEVHPRRRRGGA